MYIEHTYNYISVLTTNGNVSKTHITISKTHIHASKTHINTYTTHINPSKPHIHDIFIKTQVLVNDSPFRADYPRKLLGNQVEHVIPQGWK